MKIRFVDSVEKIWPSYETGKPLSNAQPGDACWLSNGGEGVTDADGNPVPLREHAALGYCCPGCGRYGAAMVGRAKEPSKHQWEWDGNVDEPTLRPSLHHVGCCGWHGFLTAGEFVAC